VYKCNQCQKQFSTRSGLAYHRNNCSSVSSVEKSQYHQTENIITNTITNNNYGSSTTINNIINHLVIKKFGCENTDHITKDVAIKCFQRGIYGLVDMIDLIYFNDDVPENHNIKMKSLKNMLVEVFQDPDWETRDFSETVDKMIRTSRDHILKDMDFMDISKDMEMLNTANTLMSVPAKNVKSMRNHTKAKLVDRRLQL
jgi:hypothetical protein